MIRRNQYGFSVIEMLLVVGAVSLMSFTGWYVWHSKYHKVVSPGQSNANGKWLSYTDSKYGFSYEYPPDMTVPQSSDWLELENGGGSFTSSQYVPKGEITYAVHTTESAEKNAIEPCFGCFFRVDVIKASMQDVVHHEDVDSNGAPITDVVEQTTQVNQVSGFKIYRKSKPNNITYLLQAHNYVYRVSLIEGDTYWEKSFSTFRIL